jgi:hypothetical protein
MSFYSDQAAQFEQTAGDLQTRLDNEGATMDDATYKGLEAKANALEKQANVMIAKDIQATLDQLKLDEARLTQCTNTLQAAVKTLKKFDQLAAVVAAAITFATALASGDPGAIATAVVGAEKAVAAAAAKTPVVPIAAPGAAAGPGLAIAASDDPAKPGN